MILGLQIIGILFGLIMLYLTFLYFKRKDYTIPGFVFWTIIWIGFMILVIVPTTIYGLMESLQIERTVDFFVIAGFLFFSVVIFHVYDITKRTQKKVEELVRKIAIDKELKK